MLNVIINVPWMHSALEELEDSLNNFGYPQLLQN